MTSLANPGTPLIRPAGAGDAPPVARQLAGQFARRVAEAEAEQVLSHLSHAIPFSRLHQVHLP
jgi:hypothetical protein